MVNECFGGEGSSIKVLNECKRKNVELGILDKVVFNKLPLRVGYYVILFGEKFLRILDELEKLQYELES
ncbi:hypothetical protein C9J03_04015 [Photobacterium gaetbulicola]|nr:hypothetical protein C9J03_04015 [Photobacterium gaetbulicola]